MMQNLVAHSLQTHKEYGKNVNIDLKNLAKLEQYHYLHAEFLEEIRYF